MKIACPRIVTEALPGVENIGFSRAGKRADSGKTAEPSNIVRDYGGGLGLLEHDLGDEDDIGVVAAAPGEIAAVIRIPAKKRGSEGADVF